MLLGATAFYASDICVARSAFVSPGIENSLVGLPLYYASLVLFARSLWVDEE